MTLTEAPPLTLSLPAVFERLEQIEPVDTIGFTVGSDIRFSADTGANHGIRARQSDEPVGVTAYIAGTDYQLTREAYEQTAQLIGFRRDYVGKVPADLVVPHLNYWLRGGLLADAGKPRDYRYLTRDGYACALTKQAAEPLSNVTLLDTTVKTI